MQCTNRITPIPLKQPIRWKSRVSSFQLRPKFQIMVHNINPAQYYPPRLPHHCVILSFFLSFYCFESTNDFRIEVQRHFGGLQMQNMRFKRKRLQKRRKIMTRNMPHAHLAQAPARAFAPQIALLGHIHNFDNIKRAEQLQMHQITLRIVTERTCIL